MIIKKKFQIGIFSLIIMLIGVVFIASASTNSSQDTLSKGAIFEFNDSNSQRNPLPDFGPHTFDELKKDPNVLTTKGIIPRYATQEKRQEWLGKLDNIRVLADGDLSPFAYPKGPVYAHGFEENGTMEIFLYKGMNVTDSQINEIYDMINKIGNKENIQNVPVIFLKCDLIQNTLSGYDTYRRPVIGAIQLTGQTGDIGSVGFAAKTSSGTKGYVTVQHLGTSVGYQMYQPSLYVAGTVSKISGSHADACFVPYSDVSPYVYINNGNTLPVVTYMSAKPTNSWTGLTVYKSGRTTGVTSGTIQGIINLDGSEGIGTYTGMIKTNVQNQGGDSGGPLYTMPTSANSCNILGISKGNLNGYSLFSSVYGINYDLGVLPITT
jgi:streptogrisin B